jgi:hypothetical protein
MQHSDDVNRCSVYGFAFRYGSGFASADDRSPSHQLPTAKTFLLLNYGSMLYANSGLRWNNDQRKSTGLYQIGNTTWRKIMTKKLVILSSVLATCLAVAAIPAWAETTRVKVVGVTTDKSKGTRNPARRHEDCANDFDNGHWCSTQEYLEGGMAMPADEKLDTAWIRPTIISAVYTQDSGLVYVGVSGGAAKPEDVNCNQWSTKDRRFRGTVLQKQKDDDRQVVSTRQCSEEFASLCCAPVTDDL